MASFSFDASTVAKRDTFTLLPAGQYVAQIVDSEIVPLNSGNGSALKLTFQVLTEGHAGRKVWARLNVVHSNPMAEKIAQEELREILEAAGLARMNDSVELHNKPMSIRVKIRVDESGKYEPQNEIKGYTAIVGQRAAPQANSYGAAAVPPAAMAARPAAPAAPWMKTA